MTWRGTGGLEVLVGRRSGRGAVIGRRRRFLLPPQLRHLLLHLDYPPLPASDLERGGVELGAQPRVLGLQPVRGLPPPLELVLLGRELGLQERHDGDGLPEYLLLQQLHAEARLTLLEVLDGAEQLGDLRRRAGGGGGSHLRGRAREVCAEGPRERRRLGERRAVGRRGARRGRPGRRPRGGRRRRLRRRGLGAAVEAHGRLDAPGHHGGPAARTRNGSGNCSAVQCNTRRACC